MRSGITCSHLDDSWVTALHKGMNGEIMHPILPDYLGSDLVRFKGVQQYQRDVWRAPPSI